MPAMDFAEGMQLLRPRLAEQPIPRLGAEAHDARQAAFEIAETDGADEARQVAAHGPHRVEMFLPLRYRRNEEDGGARKR
jgi:hypothetical protein